MKQDTVYLTSMFPDYEPPEELLSALSQAAIVAADIDPASRRVHVAVHSEQYIPRRLLEQAEREIGQLYGLSHMEVTATHPASELTKLEPEELRDLFVTRNSMTRGSLAGATWEWEGTNLTVKLRANGKKELEKLIPEVQNQLRERFAAPVTIRIEAGQTLEGQALFDAMESMRTKLMDSIPAIPAKPEEKKPDPQSDTFYGKPFRGIPVPMSELNLDMGAVIVEGRVFNVEHKELKKRNAWVIGFDMTDNTNSIHINRFLEAGEAKPILENVQVGSVLKVQGRLELNRYDNEMVLKPYAMMPGSMPKRKDTAEGMKRVELHLHTIMSNMDALTDTTAAIKQAAAWGHKAIAITDHGCCQSFTDALHTVEGKKPPKVAGTDETIKILYGCEGYYVNDVDDRIVVHGQQDISFDEEFVAFDLETTGLSSKNDRIIEIGAVILKNGQEIDRFQTFVDPQRKLDKKIVDLTGITDEMLAGAPSLEEVLPEFLKFVGGRVLVAHNSDFDTGFIREACLRLGYPYHYTAADTLILSQNLLPQLNKFKLDIVANALSLPEFNHHRAADDAVMCGLIMTRLMQKLEEEYDIHTLQAINPAMITLRSKGRIADRHARHIILFAKNQVGLRNLYHLISDSNLKYFKRVPRIPKSELMALREGLIIGSACEAGELFQAILDHKSEDELKRLASFYDFLEIQPLDNNRFMLDSDKYEAQTDEDLREYNRKIVRLGEELGKMVVATGDVHFLNPEDEVFRHILLATKGFDDADKKMPLYFRTTDEMLKEFSYLGQEKAYEIVVENPNKIADMCETLRPVPHNLFAPKIENSVEDLKSLVYGKFHRLYGDNPPEVFRQRVETELHDIISCHYDVIYMSAQKLVQNSLEHNYLVGSRGSVGSSIVAYMSGITEVNSFQPHYRCPNPACKYTELNVPPGYNCGADLPDAVCPKCGTKMEKDGFNIPFETFLGFGGDKVPDIDLNFSGEYQAEAHKYCISMFGSSHVFRAGTIGTVAEKTAFGYVKKYLQERGRTASKAEEARLASGCVGVRRTTGQHPGGLVVIPQENEIWDFCPVQHPADDPNSDQITTHFEYHSMEENLLKLDMLGHDDPTMIRMMEDMTGVDAKTIPLDDKDTMSIFTSSKVLGYENDKILGPTGAVAIPEFNTRFTRGMLMDTMPTRFDTLVRLSGFSHGTDVWLGNAKDLITSKTATVDSTIGCRDDIMLYLISCGMPEKRSFKIMESVRKGRGLPEGAEEEMKAAGVPEWYIGSCKKIKYLFPKAHAVAYVMMAFRIAWFKVHHPLPFYAAYFYRRSQKGGFDAVLMTGGIASVMANIEAIDNNEDATAKDEDLLTTLEVVYEFYLRGFEFAPIDIYESHATKFLIKDGKLLPPFVAISGLGESAAWDLMEGRKGKQFLSIEEVAAACPKVSKTHIQMLKDAGAFGSLPDTSQVSFF
ncbi:MAG: PolC-type DNA polymerase III [Clostridiales bacterium]|nr:PolC-type DNA polymerase III [Clostridiales bacterium]MDD7386586.1 PolC-type DNA polymerase III [Bacillota bacterium]